MGMVSSGLILQPGGPLTGLSIPELPGEWKYISLNGDTLLVLSALWPDPAETSIVRSPYTHWTRGELSPGCYARRIPWGLARTWRLLVSGARP